MKSELKSCFQNRACCGHLLPHIYLLLMRGCAACAELGAVCNLESAVGCSAFLLLGGNPLNPLGRVGWGLMGHVPTAWACCLSPPSTQL